MTGKILDFKPKTATGKPTPRAKYIDPRKEPSDIPPLLMPPAFTDEAIQARAFAIFALRRADWERTYSRLAFAFLISAANDFFAAYLGDNATGRALAMNDLIQNCAREMAAQGKPLF